MFIFWMAKTLLVRYIWKVVRNLFNISSTEGVTASHLNLRRWSLHLSAGQRTGSSCTSNSGAAASWETHIHCPNRPDINRWISALICGKWCKNESTTRANTGHDRSEEEGDEHLDWVPAECNRRSSWSVAKRLDTHVHAQVGHFEQCFDSFSHISFVESATLLSSSNCCKLLK